MMHNQDENFPIQAAEQGTIVRILITDYEYDSFCIYNTKSVLEFQHSKDYSNKDKTL